MLPFESIEPRSFRPTRRSATRPPLPLYVEPAPDEALLSWLLRLATRLRVALHVLASQCFAVDDRGGHTRWWCRPHPWVLARISERSGVSVRRLRQMTFEGLEPVYRDDEASARFTGRRYDARSPEQRGYRFAVCGDCLKSDAAPYLRRLWLVGWTAGCPHHGTRLIERCEACGAALRVAPLASAASFAPATCTRCAASLLDGDEPAAHPAVLRMQAALFRGKSEGFTEFPGLGRLTWKEMVALADVLIGMVWTDLTLAEQKEIFHLYTSDASQSLRDDDGIYDCRHGSLQFLAWFTEGWPDSPGAKVGRSMLVRWLNADRNRLCRHLRTPSADHWNVGPSNFEPPIRERLRALAGLA